MRFKFLAVLAVTALVSACETPADETADTGSTGTTATGTNSTGTGTGTTSTIPSIASGSQQDLVVNVGDSVFFGYDQFTLEASSREVLDRQAAWLKANPSVMLTIEGHCDERGTREYNLALGDRRANSSKAYLVALGVNPSRLTVVSYGKERPVAMGSTEASWSQNRRSVSVVN